MTIGSSVAPVETGGGDNRDRAGGAGRVLFPGAAACLDNQNVVVVAFAQMARQYSADHHPAGVQWLLSRGGRISRRKRAASQRFPNSSTGRSGSALRACWTSSYCLSSLIGSRVQGFAASFGGCSAVCQGRFARNTFERVRVLLCGIWKYGEQGPQGVRR
jgi:hypothetical protein